MVRINKLSGSHSMKYSRPSLVPAREECQIIADWISPLNFKVTQRDTFEQRTEGTGQWLLDSHEFNGWLAGESRTFWCFGMRKMFFITILFFYLTHLFWVAGSGKTVLS
jgi:hypothetical protein